MGIFKSAVNRRFAKQKSQDALRSSTQDTLGRGRRRRRKVLRVGQLAVGTYLSSVLTRVWRLRQRLCLDRQLLPRATPRDGLVHQPSLFGQWVRWKKECTCGDGFYTCPPFAVLPGNGLAILSTFFSSLQFINEESGRKDRKV